MIRIICWTAGAILLLLLACFGLLNTNVVQNKLKNLAMEMLSEKLHTEVALDDVSVKFFSQDISLHGLHVKDRQQRDMLEVETLSADVKLLKLLRGEVDIASVDVEGITAHLYKEPEDSVANYQFVIDAFRCDSTDSKSGYKLTLNVNDIDVKRVDITYNDKELKLDRLDVDLERDKVDKAVAEQVTVTYDKNVFNIDRLDVDLDNGKVEKAKVEQINAKWTRPDHQNHTVSYQAGVESVDIELEKGCWNVKADGVSYLSNNHLPRKNKTNPKRGFFDAGHLDITANLRITVNHASTDSVHAMVTQCTAVDKTTGIDIRDLRCSLAANRHRLLFSNVKVQQGETKVSFASGILNLPDSVHGLKYKTSPITVHAVLRDISRPFAPILANFTIPLVVSTVMSGTSEQINFSNVSVRTADNKFHVAAAGTVQGFRHKEAHELHVHFDVAEMKTTPAEVERIIKQFPINRFMMKQMYQMGSIRYVGSFDVLWKKEQFRGSLYTNVGELGFEFTLDQLAKSLSGKANGTDIDAGTLLDMPAIGTVTCNADFNIDLGPRKNNGKLPIGEATAHVDHASYKKLSVSNLDLSVKSDGMTADGDLDAPHKFIDLGCSYSFTDTDNLKKLKIKPHISFHKAQK